MLRIFLQKSSLAKLGVMWIVSIGLEKKNCYKKTKKCDILRIETANNPALLTRGPGTLLSADGF